MSHDVCNHTHTWRAKWIYEHEGGPVSPSLPGRTISGYQKDKDGEDNKKEDTCIMRYAEIMVIFHELNSALFIGKPLVCFSRLWACADMYGDPGV